MAEAAICSIPPTIKLSVDMPHPNAQGKRKTPSELRSEQLKRLHNDQDQAMCSSDRNRTALKQDASKPPRFTDTRVPDIYAASKPGDRSSRLLLSEKKKCTEQGNRNTSITTVAERTKVLGKFQWKRADDANHTDVNAVLNLPTSEINSVNQTSSPVPFSTFRDVTQISTGLQGSSSGQAVDMAKAFKGMSATKVINPAEHTAGTSFPAKALRSISELGVKSQVKSSTLCIQGEKLPLDLSLKTSMRFTSASSFERCHRLTNMDLFAGMQKFLCANQCQAIQTHTGADVSTVNKVGVLFAEALHSWVYPQAVLPSSVLSTLASAAAHGSISERDFLARRQLAWEDSFRSLYYMFRNGQCELFYFCTQQFLVMFINGGLQKKNRKAVSAYMTRSTRGLRALLQEQDIVFTMPLCASEVATSIEEIQELTEFEKTHPGQTRLVDSMIALDNSPESVLAFNGPISVHGLYDLLLNYRSLLSSTTGADVPCLYSPVSFEHATLRTPEVTCKQLQRPADANEERGSEQSSGLAMNTSFMLEIKGTVLPPWVVWRVCKAVRQFQPGTFEASLITDPLSVGFNVAQDYEDTTGGMEQDTAATTSMLVNEVNALLLSTEMRVSCIKHLKMVEGSYTVSLSTV